MKNTSVVLSRHYSESGSRKYDHMLGILDRGAFDSGPAIFDIVFEIYEKQTCGIYFNTKDDYRDSGIGEFAEKLSEQHELDLALLYGDENHGLLFSISGEGADRLMNDYFGSEFPG